VGPTQRRQPPNVPAIGTVRRLQGLAAQAFPDDWVAARLRWPRARVRNLRAITHPQNYEVRRDVAAAVRALADAVGRLCGPDANAARDARSRGWVPLRAWVGEIDNPAVVVPPGLVTPARGGGDIDLAEVALLRGYGLTLDEIAAKLAVQRDSITRAQARANGRKAAQANTRYPDDQVVAAVRRVLAGEPRQAVAAELGISKPHLDAVVAGRFRPELLAQATRPVGGETPEALAEHHCAAAAQRAAEIAAARRGGLARVRKPRYSDDVLVAAVRRVLAGESYRAVAADSGVSRTHLSGLVHGRRRPDLLEQAKQPPTAEAPQEGSAA
jgi:hypothetical protein